MRHWLTRPDPALRQGWIKRFEPSHWSVDFPRGTMASVVSEPGEQSLTVTAAFGGRGDLVGLIYTTVDAAMHVGHRRAEKRNYSRCTLRFRWQSDGLVPLDEVDGPTLTIEGRDQTGAPRIWYVRLWNYAVGSSEDAVITLPFDNLVGGFSLPADADPVVITSIDRLFFSIVPAAYIAGSSDRFPVPVAGWVRLSEISCQGSGSIIPTNDTFVPEHGLRICTAYDDCYQLTPERVIDSLERLGYRGLINHYVGMSHYPALTGQGLADPSEPLCTPARRWHESFAAIAHERGYDVIWSISMELLEQFCPDDWKQRAWDGEPAQTGYVPPSTLLSPAVPAAVDFLGSVALAFVDIGSAVGLQPLVQIGEPWWWVRDDGAICLYDEAANAMWAPHEPITDIRFMAGSASASALDRAGEILAAATSAILARVRASHPAVTTHLLAYLPSILRRDAVELKRANLPVGWTAPAFDVLQLEDYEWVTEGRVTERLEAQRATRDRLGYAPEDTHYLAGFAASADRPSDWRDILDAARQARQARYAETFIWALPQVCRDNLTIFEGPDEVESFRDVTFPIELGTNATIEPRFSTLVTTSAGGFEFRNVNWQQARLRFDVGPCIKSLDDLQSLLHFFRSVRGSAIAFRLRDPTDFSSSGMAGEPSQNDVLLGVGDGARRRFDLVKTYGDGEVRRVTRPVEDSVAIAVDGVVSIEWVLLDHGVIEFIGPPPEGAEVSAGFLFDTPVRFEDDALRISRHTHLAGEIVSVPLIEVREA